MSLADELLADLGNILNKYCLNHTLNYKFFTEDAGDEPVAMDDEVEDVMEADTMEQEIDQRSIRLIAKLLHSEQVRFKNIICE